MSFPWSQACNRVHDMVLEKGEWENVQARKEWGKEKQSLTVTKESLLASVGGNFGDSYDAVTHIFPRKLRRFRCVVGLEVGGSWTCGLGDIK